LWFVIPKSISLSMTCMPWPGEGLQQLQTTNFNLIAGLCF
jgi:hypothetical protein